MKTESVKLPVTVAEDDLPGFACIYDADGKQLCRTIPTPHAHAIARALNTQTQLLEAAVQLQAVLDAHETESLDCDRSGREHCDCLTKARQPLRTAIAAAEKEKV